MSAPTTAARGTPAAGPTRVPAPAIRAFIRDALLAVEIPADDAARVAELMTEADLTGADAHGIFRLPHYMRRLNAGGFNRTPNITVTQTAPIRAARCSSTMERSTFCSGTHAEPRSRRGWLAQTSPSSQSL